MVTHRCQESPLTTNFRSLCNHPQTLLTLTNMLLQPHTLTSILYTSAGMVLWAICCVPSKVQEEVTEQHTYLEGCLSGAAAGISNLGPAKVLPQSLDAACACFPVPLPQGCLSLPMLCCMCVVYKSLCHMGACAGPALWRWAAYP